MDTLNQNNQTSVPVGQNGPVVKVPKIINKFVPLEKIKILLDPFLNKLKPLFATMPPETRKLLKISSIVLGSLLILLILGSMFAKKPQKSIKTIATPTPFTQPSATPELILNPSRYATDSGLLKIEGELKAIQQKLDTMDTKESNLNLPLLDFSINFDQQ